MEILKSFACILDYPSQAFFEALNIISVQLQKENQTAFEHFEKFKNKMHQLSLLDVQEIYTRSFDIQALTTLDVGYVLFGDDYKRGELLVNLNREYKKYPLKTGTELSDHLSNVLRWMAVCEDEALLAEFKTEILLPALSRIILDFDTKRIQKKSELYKKHYKTVLDLELQKVLGFSDALKALKRVLGGDELEQTHHTLASKDFLKSIFQEVSLEAL